MWIHGLRSGPPASSSSTRYLPLSLRRAATGQPAEPAPVTIKSNVSAAFVTMYLCALNGFRHDSRTRQERKGRRRSPVEANLPDRLADLGFPAAWLAPPP